MLPSLHVGSATTLARHMGHVRSRSNHSDMQSSQKMCCKTSISNEDQGHTSTERSWTAFAQSCKNCQICKCSLSKLIYFTFLKVHNSQGQAIFPTRGYNSLNYSLPSFHNIYRNNILIDASQIEKTKRGYQE